MGNSASGPSRARPAVHLALIAVQLCFASFSPVGKIALAGLPPFGLAAIRVTLAAAIFVALWLIAGRERVAPRDLLRLALYAFFGIGANQMLFLCGLSYTTATSAVVLGASIPVFTAGVALALGRERTTAPALAGLGLALGGALALTSASGFDHDRGALLGNLLIVANSLCYAVYLVLSRDVLSRVSPLTAMTLVFVFGAVMVDAFVLGAGALGLLSFDPIALVTHASSIKRATWEAVLYIVAFPTVIAYLLNALALREVPASLVAIYVYVQPVIGALLSAALLGERPTPATFGAAAAIFAGIGLVNLSARRRRARDSNAAERE